VNRDALREERDFLLASLRDLERERAAGDVSDEDYETLRRGYVARAAAVERRLGGLTPPETLVGAAPAGSRMVRRVAWLAAIAALAVAAGVLVARQSGQRLPGESFTGGIIQSTANQLATARALNFSDPGRSIEIYTEVLKIDPDNVEALTYRSWLLSLTAREAEGEVKKLALATAVADLLRAQAIDDTYPDAHCFLGIVYFRFLEQAALAKPQIDACRAKNPPAEVESFVAAIAADVDTALAGD